MILIIFTTLYRVGGDKFARAESIAQQQRLEQDGSMYRYGQLVEEAGKEIYPTNPYLDTKLESKLMGALGGTAPDVAL